MNVNYLKRFSAALFVATFFLFNDGFSQSTGNNIYAGNKFLGWDLSNGSNPLFFRTNAITRTRLNGTLTNNYLGTGYMHDVSGHFGIGLNGYFNTLDNAPLTMLHLEGANNTPFNNHFGGQYRTWMRVGTFMRENSDAMYVGLKPEGFNRSDAVVNWSDDSPITHN